jgi:hypothetical protein
MGRQPQFDPDELRFGGKIHSIVEKELSGSINDDPELALIKNLYRQYTDAGRPTDVNSWLRPRLAELFHCVGERPRWTEGQTEWPFLNGRPMTFLHQFEIPEFVFPDRRVSLAATIYVFCGVGIPDANKHWEMDFRVVQQFKSLKRD